MKKEATCEFIHEAWGPHPGCREFMTEPETWLCEEPATKRFLTRELGPEGTYLSVTYTCDEHEVLVVGYCVDVLVVQSLPTRSSSSSALG